MLAVDREDGSLHKNISSTAKESNEKLKQNKALDAISKASGDNIEELASKLQGQQLCLQDTQDITHEILAPHLTFGPDLDISCIHMYKGLVKAVAEISSRPMSILAGKDNMVLDAIVADFPEQVLNNQHVKDRWEKYGYSPLGIAVLKSPENVNKCSSQAFLDDLCAMSDSTLLLVMLNNGVSKAQCFELPQLDPGSGSSTDCKRKLCPVGLASIEENKKKGYEYHVLPVEKVGVTMKDETMALVHAAIRDHVEHMVHADSSSFQDQEPRIDRGTVHMLLKPVPADGLCFFHALRSSINFEAYQSIPRHDGGYALNSRQVALEENLAKEILQAVLDNVDYTCERDAVSAAMLHESNGTIDLELVPFLARQLRLGIRVTIAPEAGVG